MGRYKMTISRLTVDKLGVKLYDKVSAVIAEMVANSYDADATKVEVKAPMGQLLATKQKGELQDKGYTIEVIDYGIGMTPDEVNSFYLVVGAERRNDVKRGAISKKFKRKVMGNKGVGKLAPFGICEKIEVLSSGGDLVEGKDEQGNKTKGYLTAHLILDRNRILKDVEYAYEPTVGSLDGIVRPKTGTHIILRGFAHRYVPEIDQFERQLSQRFGIESPNWKIVLLDSLRKPADDGAKRTVGEFSIQKMENTEIRFEVTEKDGALVHRAISPNGSTFADLDAGFQLDDKFYPVSGWVAYSKDPYKDDLMAGVRIYCRGKIAAQTNIFNRGAGFTGEYNVRSYLVGELHADWLDETEDLIQTDRRDILWSHELGSAFEQWGQAVIKKIGNLSKEPMKVRTWDLFQAKTKLHERIDRAFPLVEQKEIRKNAMDLAKIVGQTVRKEELDDEASVSSLVQLSLLLAPHVTLDEKLRQAAEVGDSPLGVITEILKTARIAELSSFGLIAEDRVKVIQRIEVMKDNPNTIEAEFQNLITQAPWLINPQWSPIIANQAFSTLKKEFQKYYKEKTGEDLELGDFTDPNKRTDFVLSSQDTIVQIIEIKKPKHKLQNEEMERINTYVEQMNNFLEDPGNVGFKEFFSNFHVTLVCDGVSLTGLAKTAFEGLKEQDVLEHVNWRTFLLRTRKMHEKFLQEAERQRQRAVGSA